MTQVAKRYAKAIYKIVKDRSHDPHRYLRDLQTIETLFTIPESEKILRSPVMPVELKLQILNYALDSIKAEQQLKEIVEYLVNHRREGLIPKIVASFRDIIDEADGVLRGRVVTAMELLDEEKQAIAEALGRAVHKKVILETHIDKEILGGFIARVGQYLVDQSLRTKLDEIGQFVTHRAAHI
jgi:F-type H+-transporting ATPase subunit delta